MSNPGFNGRPRLLRRNASIKHKAEPNVNVTEAPVSYSSSEEFKVVTFTTTERIVSEAEPSRDVPLATSELLSLKDVGISPPPSPMPWEETLASTEGKAFKTLLSSEESKAINSLEYVPEPGGVVRYSRQWCRALILPNLQIVLEPAPKQGRTDNLPPRFQDQSMLSPPAFPRQKKAKRVNAKSEGKAGRN
ncbi:MAG: hypothetical protein Q9217_000142 [Psora testacea]